VFLYYFSRHALLFCIERRFGRAEIDVELLDDIFGEVSSGRIVLVAEEGRENKSLQQTSVMKVDIIGPQS
jgi:hypothetical protein